MKCPNCNREIANGAKFCPLCGSKIATAQVAIQSPVTTNHTTSKKTTKKKRNCIPIILLLLIVGIIGVSVLFYPNIQSFIQPKLEQYWHEKAISLFKTEQYDEGYQLLLEKNISDAEAIINHSKLIRAQNACDAGNFTEAYTLLSEVSSHGEAEEYLYAQLSFAEGDFKDTIQHLSKIPNYQDSAELCQKARYLYVKELITDTKYRNALTQLELLGDYKDSRALYESVSLEHEYSLAQAEINHGEYKTAIKILENIPKHENSASAIVHCHYMLGLESMEKNDWIEAISQFQQAGDYKDSAEKIAEVQKKRADTQATAAAQAAQKQVDSIEQAKKGLSLQFNIKDGFKKSGVFQVHSIIAKLSEDGSKYTFTVDCTLPKNTKSSFFNPPDGTVFMLTNVKGKSGRNTYTYTISREKVKSVNSITVMFSNGDNDRGHAHFKTSQLY